MLTSASVFSTKAMPPWLTPRALPRKSGICRLRAPDLIAFSRSPLRWSLAPDEEPPDLAGLSEAFRMSMLAPQTFAGNYVARPTTYTALVNTCPQCGSTGTGAVCRKDGTRRVNVSVVRPWTNAASVCDGWTANAQAAGRRIVPGDILAQASAAADALNADPLYAGYTLGASTLIEIHGVWHDEATAQDILLAATVHIAPAAENPDSNTIGRLSVTADASPGAWGVRTFHAGQLMRAALELALYNKALDDTRNSYRWLAIEKANPAVYARRAAHPSLVAAGTEQLTATLAALARCRDTDIWPGFDGTDELGNAEWSMLGIEPWMGAQNGSLPMPFAVGACAGMAA